MYNPLQRALLSHCQVSVSHSLLRIATLLRYTAKKGGRSCKRRFHRFRVKSSHFPENRIITFSTAAPCPPRQRGLPRSREARFGHELWSNRVHDTALGGNPCCTFAFLATFSLCPGAVGSYGTPASCRQVGGRAPTEASASIHQNHSPR